MQRAKKKRVLAAGLTALIVWPAIHFALVKALNIHPWRFAGWAMYAVLHPRAVTIDTWRCDFGRPPRCHARIPFGALSPGVQMKLTRFSLERSAWGALRGVDDIGNDLAPYMKGSPLLRMTLFDTILDPATNMIRQTQEEFYFQSSNR
jgi:hypothetical protein